MWNIAKVWNQHSMVSFSHGPHDQFSSFSSRSGTIFFRNNLDTFCSVTKAVRWVLGAQNVDICTKTMLLFPYCDWTDVKTQHLFTPVPASPWRRSITVNWSLRIKSMANSYGQVLLFRADQGDLKEADFEATAE